MILSELLFPLMCFSLTDISAHVYPIKSNLIILYFSFVISFIILIYVNTFS